MGAAGAEALERKVDAQRDPAVRDGAETAGATVRFSDAADAGQTEPRGGGWVLFKRQKEVFRGSDFEAGRVRREAENGVVALKMRRDFDRVDPPPGTEAEPESSGDQMVELCEVESNERERVGKIELDGALIERNEAAQTFGEGFMQVAAFGPDGSGLKIVDGV